MYLNIFYRSILRQGVGIKEDARLRLQTVLDVDHTETKELLHPWMLHEQACYGLLIKPEDSFRIQQPENESHATHHHLNAIRTPAHTE